MKAERDWSGDHADISRETFPQRAFAAGSLTGLLVTIVCLVGYTVVHAIIEYGIQSFGDLFVALFVFFQGAAFILALGYPLAAVSAFACLQFLIWASERNNLAMHPVVWAAAGTIFALPVAWLFSSEPFGGGLVAAWISACGLLGGVAARVAYTWPKRTGSLT